MLTRQETLAKNMLYNTQEREDKELGFSHHEPHQKHNFINKSPTRQEETSRLTECFSSLLSKKSQFMAKEILSQQFKTESIPFNPTTTYSSCIWNSDLFWLLPNTPSGISKFFCPEAISP